MGKCISALVKGQRHVPYYESVLTQLLKGALGGNSRTTAIVTCSSDDSNGEQSLHALRFGERCSMITNRTALSTMSVSDAVQAIDEALDACRSQMRAMEEGSNTHLPMFAKLKGRYQQLVQKRAEMDSSQNSAR